MLLDWLSFLPFMCLGFTFAEEDGAGTGVIDGEGEGDDTGEGEEGGENAGEGEGGEGEAENLFDIPLDKKVKLPNGEVVDAQELLYGYMRQDDYTKKTQELAEARRQIELSREALKGGNKPEEGARERIEGQISDVKQALSELSEDDPQAKALMVVLDKLEKLEQKVIEAEQKEAQLSQQEAYQKQVEYAKKLTDDILSEEQKSYNLPKFKNPKTGKEIDFSDRWREVVLTTLTTIDQNMTIPEYRALVKEIGRKAYERLRDEISAISASLAPAKRKPATPPTGTGEKEENKSPLTLEDKLNAAFEKLERAKQGGE